MSEPRKIAFQSPPGWFDVSPTDLLSVAPAGWSVQQTVLPLPGFTYDLDSIKKARGVVERTAKLMMEAEPDAVVQTGTPWAGFSLGSHRDALKFRDRVEAAIGVPFVCAGSAVPEALHRLGASTIALSATYYNTEWVERYVAFLESAGFAVQAAATFTEQGISQGPLPLTKGPFPTYGPRMLGGSVAAIGLAAPRADVVLIAGTHRTLSDAGDLELAAGRPIVATDLALHWSVMERAGGAGPIAGHGRLLGSLGG